MSATSNVSNILPEKLSIFSIQQKIIERRREGNKLIMQGGKKEETNTNIERNLFAFRTFFSPFIYLSTLNIVHIRQFVFF
jgi:hypothetical protein